MTSSIGPLGQLIGQRFRYLGECWTLIEILPDADLLVLRCDASTQRRVQRNLYGTPNRRSPETITLPITDPEDGGYTDEVIDLLAARLPN